MWFEYCVDGIIYVNRLNFECNSREEKKEAVSATLIFHI